MDRAKIAFIITKLELGGAQRSVLYTAANLDADRFEPFLLSGSGGYLDGIAPANTAFIPALQRAVNPFKDIPAFIRLRRALKKINPKIVHTNSSKAGILGRLAAAFIRPRPRIIHTVHGFGFNDYQNFFARGFYIFMERMLAQYTDFLVFVSHADMDMALKLEIAPPEKCLIIRAGVEVKTKADFAGFDKAAKLAQLRLPEETKIVLCPANLKPQKNPLDMVRAAQIVCKKIPQAVFLYLGTGALEKQTRALIDDFGLQNNFKLLGHRDDAPELLAVADCFALSSLWEGLPMALVEALNMQVPAVCYDAGGIAEVLHNGHNGFLVQRGDYRGLALGIIEVLEGRMKFVPSQDLKEFDIEEMLKNQENLYTELINGLL